jgi:carbon starvation protein CstA
MLRREREIPGIGYGAMLKENVPAPMFADASMLQACHSLQTVFLSTQTLIRNCHGLAGPRDMSEAG